MPQLSLALTSIPARIFVVTFSAGRYTMPAVGAMDYLLNGSHSVFVTVTDDNSMDGHQDSRESETGLQNQSLFQGSTKSLATWSTLVPLVLLISITIVGNGTVIVMFARAKRLRNFKYSFIGSLALADLAIGCTEPVSLLETVSGRWPHDVSMCKVFLVIRYSLYYVSFLSILMISVDRWCSIHHPFSYRVKQSKRLALWAIGCAWVVSFLIHGTPIIVWDYFDRHSKDSVSLSDNGNLSSIFADDMCTPPYERDVAFLSLSVFAENLLPLVALTVLNLSVYVKILRRKSTKIRRSLSTTDNFLHLSRKSSSDSETGTAEEEREILREYLKRTEPPRPRGHYKSQRRRHSISHTLFHNSTGSKLRSQAKRRVSFDVTMLSQQFTPSRRKSHTRASACDRRRSTSDDLVRDLFIRQDKKAACALGLLVVVFVLCWTPHCVVSILRASCYHCVPPWIVIVSQWVLAANSAINPFLYAIGNSEFRKVLKTWAGCEDKELSRQRENSNFLHNSYYLLVT